MQDDSIIQSERHQRLLILEVPHELWTCFTLNNLETKSEFDPIESEMVSRGLRDHLAVIFPDVLLIVVVVLVLDCRCANCSNGHI